MTNPFHMTSGSFFAKSIHIVYSTDNDSKAYWINLGTSSNTWQGYLIEYMKWAMHFTAENLTKYLLVETLLLTFFSNHNSTASESECIRESFAVLSLYLDKNIPYGF